MKKILLLASSFTLLAMPAQAQISDVRAGLNFHDIDWTGAGSGSDKERSTALNVEIVFKEPEFLKWALSPQPYVGGALNLDGETSHGGLGLLWRQTFAKNFYFDFSFGFVTHDGTIEVKPSALIQRVIDGQVTEQELPTAEREQFVRELTEFRFRQQNEIDYGSRILFREQIAIGYRWSEDWSAHIFVEHLSHGNILVSGKPNEGLDTLGFRLSRHF